jgi:hypothetical protein
MKRSKKTAESGEAGEAPPDGGALPEGICVARHPRTAVAVRRAKAWGGIAGLALTTFLALGAHLAPADALMRGLIGGAVAYVVVWALAVTVARQLVIAEVRARFAELQAAAAEPGAPASAGDSG